MFKQAWKWRSGTQCPLRVPSRLCPGQRAGLLAPTIRSLSMTLPPAGAKRAVCSSMRLPCPPCFSEETGPCTLAVELSDPISDGHVCSLPPSPICKSELTFHPASRDSTPKSGVFFAILSWSGPGDTAVLRGPPPPLPRYTWWHFYFMRSHTPQLQLIRLEWTPACCWTNQNLSPGYLELGLKTPV